MTIKFTTTISAKELADCLPDQPLILDCRHKLGEPTWGHAQFIQGHIATAQYADMDTDLASPPGPSASGPSASGPSASGKSGRHPLPEREQWVATLQSWGLSQNRQVVVYDDASGAFAARLWWMLRWVGHAYVAVLDGGLAQWSQPLAGGAAAPVAKGNFSAQPSLTQISTVADVSASVAASTETTDPTMNLIDARTEPRWAGLEEPIDPVAGHIPGAVCMPFQGNLAADGTFLSSAELKQRFASIPDPLICYCGSGVTACHNILALEIAGRQGALYVDSWSGWITDPKRPVHTHQDG